MTSPAWWNTTTRTWTDPTQTLNVLAWVHLYPPDHNAGGELMLHEILVQLAARGHTCTVYLDRSSAAEWEGVQIRTAATGNISRLIDESDVVITHLDRTRDAIDKVAGRKPLVHIVHNDAQLKYHGVKPDQAQLVIHNSEWVKQASRWRGRQMVVPPPVNPERYRTTPGDRITLINLNENKGVETFWQLARIMTDRTFLGVRGGYAKQRILTPTPPNVKVVENNPNIRAVYGETRILLMPSAYESWGRCAIEAAASGIPTIAHPTPGLKEALGNAGIFVDRNDIAGWVEAIRNLDNERVYKQRSKMALERSAQLHPDRDIDRIEVELRRLVG